MTEIGRCWVYVTSVYTRATPVSYAYLPQEILKINSIAFVQTHPAVNTENVSFVDFRRRNMALLDKSMAFHANIMSLGRQNGTSFRSYGNYFFHSFGCVTVLSASDEVTLIRGNFNFLFLSFSGAFSPQQP